MRLLVLCPKCQRQYDASARAIGNLFRCQCGEVVTVERPQGHEAAVVRCSSCGAPREEGSASCTHCGADFTLHERDLDTVCPHCLARISDRARFCHHCGKPIVPDAIVSEPSALVCPACGEGHTLASRRMGDVNVLECGRCAGLWIGKEAFRLLSERAAEMGMRLPDAARGPPPLPLDAPQVGRVYRPCPFCHGLMPRNSLGDHSGVVIDWCRDHGLWFDSEELPRALAWIRRGGAVEFNQKKAALVAERSRREARQERDLMDASGPTAYGGAVEADDWGWLWLLVGGLMMAARIFFHR